MNEHRFTVADEHDGTRLDALLPLLLPALTRSAAARLIEEGRVAVNGAVVTKKRPVRAGEQIEVSIPPPASAELVAQDIPLDIVYEDDDILVINKPKGMVVHPAVGHTDGTLVNAILHHCGGSLPVIGGEERPGIVHRIDKDTSGLICVAKNDTAHRSLARQLADHSMYREYWAVVMGDFKEDEGAVDAPIGRHPKDRKRMAVTDKNSRAARTQFWVLRRFPGHTLLRLQLTTGRTHQIRAHMAFIGHPVAGDPVYGSGRGHKTLGGQCLHAKALTLTHPATGESMHFESELPPYFQDFLAQLEQRG